MSEIVKQAEIKTESTHSPRKPWLACVLSLVLPGLGQLYNGQINKAVIVLFVLGLSTPVIAVIMLNIPGVLVSLSAFASILLFVGIYLYMAFDAFNQAKKSGEHYIVKSFNRVYVYILAILAGHLFLFSAHVEYTRTHLLESFYIPSKSMLPTLLSGDYIFADKRVNCLGCKTKLQRGDVVIFVNPNDRTQLYIKRIVGLPNDHVEIQGTRILVNGQSITQGAVSLDKTPLPTVTSGEHIVMSEKAGSTDYVVVWKKAASRLHKKLTVPNGQVFLLGDNRDATMDSRKIGTIPLVDVVGKAMQVWFSKPKNKSIHWERVGLTIH